MSTICKERILSEDYRDFILSDSRTDSFRNVPEDQLCTQMADFEYRCVYLQNLLVEPITLERFSYNSIPKCYTLLDMEAMNQAGILAIQNYPTLQLKGQNVMIGFVDTGIDYQSAVFRNLDGTTRISAIWDQTIQTGTAPDGMEYGSEYTREMIDAALENENPLEVVPSRDEHGHGTFVASLAAGSGVAEEGFLGAAPECVIGVVKLKGAKQYLKEYYFINEEAPCYQENDIMLGLKYLRLLAERQGLPLVLCIALGTNMGGHEGSLPLPSILELYAARSNLAVVIGGGNEANNRHHYMRKIENERDTDTIEIRVEEGNRGFTMELWADIPNIFSISLTSPSGEDTLNLPIRSGRSVVFDYILDRTQVSIDYRLLVERTTSELISFRFRNPTAGIWKLVVEPVQISDGQFHIWLPIAEFLTSDVFFLQSSPDYTLTNPANSFSPIVMAYYNGADNSIDINSGRGYTRDNRMNPDMAAPGVGVKGVLPNNRFAVRSGSSISAGITAGAVALLLEWVRYQLGNPIIDSIQLKSLLILGAQRRPGISYPNKEWGYGTLDLYNTFERLRQF